MPENQSGATAHPSLREALGFWWKLGWINTPGLLPLTSLVDLYRWYRLNLCQPEILDCRGYRVRFQIFQ
jgi:hypothetical protein